MLIRTRNQGKAMRRNCAMNIEPTRSWWAVVSLRYRSLEAELLMSFSWHTKCLLLWPRRPSQHPRHRSSRTFSRRPVRPLQPTVFREDSGHGGEADGTTQGKFVHCQTWNSNYSIAIEGTDYPREESDLQGHKARQLSHRQTWA